MTRPTPWTPAENAALVQLYFTMLDHAKTGKPYNKAALIRKEQLGHLMPRDNPDATGPLADRSRGSIEAKLMNASAAHRDLVPGAVTMDGFGYRCLSNYQASLKAAMLEHIASMPGAFMQGFGA